MYGPSEITELYEKYYFTKVINVCLLIHNHCILDLESANFTFARILRKLRDVYDISGQGVPLRRYGGQ